MEGPQRSFIRIVLVLLVLLEFVFSWSHASAQTDDNSRKGRWEFMIAPQYTLSRNIGFNGGTNVKIEDNWGFGIQFGYNFNEHLNLGGLFSWSRPDYQGTVQPAPGIPIAPGPRSTSGTIETSTFGMILTYNLLAGPLTPYLDAMVAGTYVNTDIASGPPIPGCFWDPWFGYICGTVQPTKYDTYLAYGFGGGLRWDVNRTFFMRGGFRQQFVDVANTGTPSFTIFKLDLGVKF